MNRYNRVNIPAAAEVESSGWGMQSSIFSHMCIFGIIIVFYVLDLVIMLIFRLVVCPITYRYGKL